MPKEISTVQHNIDTLLKSSGRINDAVDKIASLQHLIDETEKRIDEVNASKKSINDTEQRLTKLSNNADEQLRILRGLVKNEGSKTKTSSSSAADATSPSKREAVISLKRKGWTVEEIAKAQKLTISEVELILELGK